MLTEIIGYFTGKGFHFPMYVTPEVALADVTDFNSVVPSECRYWGVQVLQGGGSIGFIRIQKASFHMISSGGHVWDGDQAIAELCRIL